MGDSRIAYKSFNPYDLGAVSEATRELREGGHGPRSSEPYIPPSLPQNGIPSASRSDSDEAGRKAKS